MFWSLTVLWFVCLLGTMFNLKTFNLIGGIGFGLSIGLLNMSIIAKVSKYAMSRRIWPIIIQIFIMIIGITLIVIDYKYNDYRVISILGNFILFLASLSFVKKRI